MEKGSTEEIKLRDQMRTLWQDRVTCTRELLVSIAADLEEDADNIFKRLRKNQEDIGDALKPYLEKYLFCWDDIPGNDSAILSDFLFQSFGINWIKAAEGVVTGKEDNDKTIVVKSVNNSVYIRLNDERTRATLELDIGGRPHEFKFNAKAENGKLNIYLDNSENRNMLTTLLKTNITMSKNFIKARKAGNTSMGLEAADGLKTNAVSIAAFLSGLNPDWSHKLLETLLLDYFSLLRAETSSHLSELLSPKGLELLPTIPKDLVAQHIPEQERDVVGSALWKPVYQGQPVSIENDVNINIDVAHVSKGTIHLNPEGREFSLPLDPKRYKNSDNELIEHETLQRHAMKIADALTDKAIYNFPARNLREKYKA